MSFSAFSSDVWYLAASKPRQEFRAVENLLNQGINAFCPLISVEKVRAGKKVVVDEAMFTGYVFINLSPEDGLWHKVRSTRGIRDWVRFSGMAAKLPTQLVESLIESEQNEANVLVKKSFASGDSVRILSGPFEGLKGIYLAENGEKRSLILIEFLGNQNRLKVDNSQIITD
jgi:transcriptional antiterminator RfaH